MEFQSLSRRRSSALNVHSDEERGETDVFAGYLILHFYAFVHVQYCNLRTTQYNAMHKFVRVLDNNSPIQEGLF